MVNGLGTLTLAGVLVLAGLIGASGVAVPGNDQTVVYTLDDERCDVSQEIDESTENNTQTEDIESERDADRDRSVNDRLEDESEREKAHRQLELIAEARSLLNA